MDSLFDKANAEYNNRNFKAAEEFYTEFINQNFDHSENLSKNLQNQKNLCTAFNNRGQIKYLRVDFNEAIEDYSEAILLDNKNAAIFYNRGLIHYRMGRYSKAIQDFDISLSINPKFIDSQQAKEIANLERTKIGGDRKC